jgi:hypothetical protein
MFDNYLINKDSLFNVKLNGAVIGFCVSVRHANYRGVFLSLHNGYYLSVDGVEYPVSVQSFEINNRPPRLFSETAKACWEHWDYDDEAVLHISHPKGLSAGKHVIRFQQCVLAAYGYLPTDQLWVENPPIPGSGAGSDKTPMIITYEVELQGERTVSWQ